MTVPEWKLEKTATNEETYQFANTNPKMVFLLALSVAFSTVACAYFAFVLITTAIEMGIIPRAPNLDGLVG